MQRSFVGSMRSCEGRLPSRSQSKCRPPTSRRMHRSGEWTISGAFLTTCGWHGVRNHAEPGNCGVAQGSSRPIDGHEAGARNAQRASGKRKRQKRNRRRKHGGKKHGEDPVILHPPRDSPEKARRHMAMQCRFTSSAPEIPGSVSANKAPSWPYSGRARMRAREPQARVTAGQCCRAKAEE